MPTGIIHGRDGLGDENRQPQYKLRNPALMSIIRDMYFEQRIFGSVFLQKKGEPMGRRVLPPPLMREDPPSGASELVEMNIDGHTYRHGDRVRVTYMANM